MAELAGVSKAKIIVELGAAHGNVTKEILKLMLPDARLYSIEINKTLWKELCKIEDERLTPIYGSAVDVKELIKQHQVEQADCVISTVPLATMPKTAKEIIKNVKQITKGPLVQIQYSKAKDKFLKEKFNKVEIVSSKQNIPPALLYKCQ